MRVEEGKRRAALQEGEDSVGDFVDGEVFADVPLRGLPHKGALRGVELGQEGAVALGGSEGRPVGDRLMETPGGWVDLGGGEGEPKGAHALAVFY